MLSRNDDFYSTDVSATLGIVKFVTTKKFEKVLVSTIISPKGIDM